MIALFKIIESVRLVVHVQAARNSVRWHSFRVAMFDYKVHERTRIKMKWPSQWQMQKGRAACSITLPICLSISCSTLKRRRFSFPGFALRFTVIYHNFISTYLLDGE